MKDNQLDAGKNVARGVAALFVCIDHSYGFFLEPHFGPAAVYSRYIALAANQSVMVFFAISGFLITKSILANIERNTIFSPREFFFARIARIYPPLVFSVALTCLLYWVTQGLGLPGSSGHPYQIGTFPLMREMFVVSAKDPLLSLVMCNGLLLANGPLWTLCIEWWIYVTIGLAVSCFRCMGPLRKVLWAGALAIALVRLYSVNAHALFFCSIWFFGGALALAKNSLARFATLRQGLIGSTLLAISLIGFLEPELVFTRGAALGWREIAAQFVALVFWCALIFPENGLVRQGTLFHLGKCSYTLYITHFPVMLFLLTVLQLTYGTTLLLAIGAFIFSVVLSVVVAHFSARYFEDKNRFLAFLYAAEAVTIQRVSASE